MAVYPSKCNAYIFWPSRSDVWHYTIGYASPRGLGLDSKKLIFLYSIFIYLLFGLPGARFVRLFIPCFTFFCLSKQSRFSFPAFHFYRRSDGTVPG